MHSLKPIRKNTESGHARKRVHGLDASKMLVRHGGKQPPMMPSQIKQEDGYLGPYESILKVGDIQYFQYREEDEGPFHMDKTEREETKYTWEEEIEGVMVGKTKEDLVRELNVNQIQKIDSQKMKMPELQILAEDRGISLQKPKVITKQGWLGAPKGLLQVLWERGWIDEEIWQEYRRLATDGNGEPIEDLSLSVLMASCLDFANEVTELQSVGRKMTIDVLLTPKYHCEMAGEGIEFAWGVAKAKYRSKLLLAEKKQVSGFHRHNYSGSCQEI